MKTSSPKKASAAKKTPAEKKTVAAKTATASKKTAPKAAAKVSTPAKKTVPAKAPSSPAKKPALKTKSVPVKKSSVTESVSKAATSAKKTVKEKIIPKVKKIDAPQIQTSTPQEGVKIIGILHLVGNILSGGTLGIILILGYLLFKKDSLSALEKETCYEIINFNLSFIIYMGISALLIFVIIGIILAPIVGLTWLVLLILGFLSHLAGENYKYPFIIRFIG